jgi:hypothetical protein
MTARSANAIVRIVTEDQVDQGGGTMEPSLLEAEDLGEVTDERLLVHAWRAEQLGRLGLPHVLAEAFADRVDWRALAALVERGCAPVLALEIVR